MDKYAGAPEGATKLIARRDAQVKCAACGKLAERRMRGQRYCSKRCRQASHRKSAAGAIKNAGPYSGDATTPHKSASNFNELQSQKTGSSSFANAPLNILGGGSFRWPNTPKLDRRTLESIRRSEIGAAPLYTEVDDDGAGLSV
jgi:endogenous inhibitor of DNA gyrase (YacG/DUF329 family)